MCRPGRRSGPTSLPGRRGAALVGARKKELANHPLIREQAFGEALDPAKLERLGVFQLSSRCPVDRTVQLGDTKALAIRGD